jgi:hypothetical protein
VSERGLGSVERIAIGETLGEQGSVERLDWAGERQERTRSALRSRPAEIQLKRTSSATLADEACQMETSSDCKGTNEDLLDGLGRAASAVVLGGGDEVLVVLVRRRQGHNEN